MFRPLRDYILVKPQERIASQIIEVILHERPNIGTVVAVGVGKIDDYGQMWPMDVKPGDTIRMGEVVKFPEYWDGAEKYLILQESDVVGIVEN